MTCECICKCTSDADFEWEPKLCTACGLCESIDQSAIPKHGLPYVPTVWTPIEPSVAISDDAKDKAITEAVLGEIGL